MTTDTDLMREGIEKMARAIALYFTPNTQPDMSGNPFAKLLPHQRRNAFDAATAALAAWEAHLTETSGGK